MTKNEVRLLYVLFFVILGVAFYFSNGYWDNRKESTENRITKYEKQIQDLNKSSGKDTATEKSIDVKYATVEEANSYILKELQRFGIEPTRYEISGKGSKQKIGVTFNAAVDDFISFLYRSRDAQTPYTIINFTSKPIDGNLVSVDLQIEPIYSLSEKDVDNKSRSALRRFFKYVAPPVDTVEEEVKDVVVNTTVFNGNNVFHLIGKIAGEDGTVYLMLKKNDGNRLIKIPVYDTGEDKITFEYEGSTYSFVME